MDGGTRPRAATLVDAHAHLYPCFDPDAQFDAARGNFDRAADELGLRLESGVLLLAQPAGDDAFERLAATAARGDASGASAARWTCSPTGEPESLAARRADGAELFVVCGRQVRAAEGIEVLALGTLRSFEDGHPAAAVIAEAAAAGAIPVLPWGVGKWLGRRGRLVRAMIESGTPGLACGDSGTRPLLWPSPRLLRLAGSRGLRVLSGSDPLPIPGEAGRTGSFGFALPGSLSAERPAADLKRLLADPGAAVTPYGRPERPLRFLRHQVALRRPRPGGPCRA